jgi:hypothetical protein
MTVLRGVQSVSYEAGAVLGQYIPVKLSNGKLVKATSQGDIIRGITLIDSIRLGEGIDIAINSGCTVLCKVGVGGWSAGDRLGLGSDFESLVVYNPAVHNQVIGIAETTETTYGVLAPITLLLQVKTA